MIALEFVSLTKFAKPSTLTLRHYIANAIPLISLIIGGYDELVPFITIF